MIIECHYENSNGGGGLRELIYAWDHLNEGTGPEKGPYRGPTERSALTSVSLAQMNPQTNAIWKKGPAVRVFVSPTSIKIPSMLFHTWWVQWNDVGSNSVIYVFLMFSALVGGGWRERLFVAEIGLQDSGGGRLYKASLAFWVLSEAYSQHCVDNKRI